MNFVAGRRQTLESVEEILQDCERELGGTGELGVSAALFDRHGNSISVINFKADMSFPMASVVKVPIGLTLAVEVANRAISFNDKINITSRNVTPGPVLNPLDRLYYWPFDASRTETIERLLGFMLRYSDNTATDAVLSHLGGTAVITEFLSRANIEGMRVTRTIRELLTYYYDLQDTRSSQNDWANLNRRTHTIFTTIRKVHPAYECRMNKEECLIESGEDICTPKAMNRLLSKASREFLYEPVLKEMRRCTTGNNRIPRIIGRYGEFVKGVAHKSGSLGGITNDVGVVDFHSGHVAVMTIMICKSTAPMSYRENTIASVASAIIAHWIGEGQLPAPGQDGARNTSIWRRL